MHRQETAGYTGGEKVASAQASVPLDAGASPKFSIPNSVAPEILLATMKLILSLRSPFLDCLKNTRRRV